MQCERLHITGLLLCRAGHILWEARTQTRDASLSMCTTKVRDSLVPSTWANSQAEGNSGDHREAVSTPGFQAWNERVGKTVRRQQASHTKGRPNKGPL